MAVKQNQATNWDDFFDITEKEPTTDWDKFFGISEEEPVEELVEEPVVQSEQIDSVNQTPDSSVAEMYGSTFDPGSLVDPTNVGSSLKDLVKKGFDEWSSNNLNLDALTRIKTVENPQAIDPQYSAGLNPFNPVGGFSGFMALKQLEERYGNPEKYKESQYAYAAEDLQRSAEYINRSKDVVHSPSVQRMLEAPTFAEAFSAFAEDPIRATLEVSARSGMGMLESIGTGLTGVPLGPSGFAVMTGVGSANVEYAASITEGLKKAGVDVTDVESIADFVADEDSMKELYNYASTRAVAIGAFDALTAGIATKIRINPISTIAASKFGKEVPFGGQVIENVAFQTVVQMAGGASGEASAQLLTEGEIKEPGAVFAEAIGEISTVPVDVGLSYGVYKTGKNGDGQYYMDAQNKIRFTTGKIPKGFVKLNEEDIPNGTMSIDNDGTFVFVPDEDTIQSDLPDTPQETLPLEEEPAPVVEEPAPVTEKPTEETDATPVLKPVPPGVDLNNLKIKTNRATTGQGDPVTIFTLGDIKRQYVKLQTMSGSTMGTYHLRNMMGEYVNTETGRPTDNVSEANTGETTLKNLKQKLIDDYKAQFDESLPTEATTTAIPVAETDDTPIDDTPIDDTPIDDVPVEDSGLSKGYERAIEVAGDIGSFGSFALEDLQKTLNVTEAIAQDHIDQLVADNILQEVSPNEYVLVNDEIDDTVGSSPVLDDILPEDDNPLLDDQTDDSIYEDNEVGEPYKVKFKTAGKVSVTYKTQMKGFTPGDNVREDVVEYSVFIDGEPSGYAIRKISKKQAYLFGHKKAKHAVYEEGMPNSPYDNIGFFDTRKQLENKIRAVAKAGITLDSDLAKKVEVPTKPASVKPEATVPDIDPDATGPIVDLSQRPDSGFSQTPTPAKNASILSQFDKNMRMFYAAQGFNLNQPFFHWTEKSFEQFAKSVKGKYGQGVYLSSNKSYGKRYVDLDSPNARRVTAYVKGKIATRDDLILADKVVGDPNKSVEERETARNKYLEDQGFVGLNSPDGKETLIFNSDNVIATESSFQTKKDKIDYQKASDIINRSNEITGSQAPEFGPGYNYVGLFDEHRKSQGTPPPDASINTALGGKASNHPIRRAKILKPLLKALKIPLFNGNIARSMKVGKNVLGYHIPGKDVVRVARVNDLEIVAHEIAHLIDFRNPEIREFYSSNTFPSEMKDLQRSFIDRKVVQNYVLKNPQFSGPQPLFGPAIEIRTLSYVDNNDTLQKSKGPRNSQAYNLSLKEGFAEFHRLYMTQPEVAKEMAPNIYNWYENWLKSSPYGKAIKKAQKGMIDWYNQDYTTRFASKIGDEGSVNTSGTRRSRLRQATIDDMQGIKNFVLAAYERGETFLDQENPYHLVRNVKNASAFVGKSFQDGAPVVKKTIENGKQVISFAFEGVKLVDEIIMLARNNPDIKGDHLQLFYHYLYAQTSLELQEQGRQNRFDIPEMQAVINTVEANHPQMIKAFENYLIWNSQNVQFGIDMGLLSEQQVGRWERQKYVPTFTVETNKTKQGRSRNVSLDRAAYSVQRAYGSSENLAPAGENIIAQVTMLLTQALHNEAKRTTIQAIQASSAMGMFMEPARKVPKMEKIPRSEVQNIVTQLMDNSIMDDNIREEVLEEMIDTLTMQPDYMQFYTFGHSQGGKNIVQYMDKGKPYEVEIVDEQLYKSFQSFTPPRKKALVRWLSLPKVIGQTTITLGPRFLLASIYRETIGNAIFSKTGQIPFANSIRGFYNVATNSPEYQSFIANGGGYSSYFTSEDMLDLATQRITTTGNKAVLITSARKLLLEWQNLANNVEMATKFTEFQKARERGDSPRYAAYLGREIGGDFAMRGTNEGFNNYTSTVMFQQAGLTALDWGFRSVSEKSSPGQRRAVAAKAGAFALFAGGLVAYSLKHFKEEYDELEDWEKLAYSNIFYRDPLTGEVKLFRLPKLYEIGVIANIAEQSVEFAYAVMTGDTANADQKEFATGTFDTMLRLVTTLPMVPQFIKVVGEQAVNQDFFTGAPIETMGMEAMPASQRQKKGGSPLISAMTDRVSDVPVLGEYASAPRIEHFVNSIFNGASETALALLDTAYYAVSDDLAPPVKKPLEQLTDSIAFWDGKTIAGGRTNTKSVTEFYEALNGMQEQYRAMRTQAKRGQNDRAVKSMHRFNEAGGILDYKIAVATNRDITKLRQMIDYVYYSKSYTIDEKESLTEALYSAINGKAAEALDAMYMEIKTELAEEDLKKIEG